MKKKIVCAFSLAVICAGAMAYSCQYFLSSSSNNAMLMENIEALSNFEGGSGNNTCYNSITSKAGCMVRYCPTCSFVSGTDAWYSYHSHC